MKMGIYYWIQNYAVECKCVGSCCILFGTGYLAYNLNLIYEQRKNQLFDLCNALIQLKNEIQYEYKLLPECFGDLSASSKAPFNQLFFNLKNEMIHHDNEAFSIIWEKAIKWLLHNSSLTKEDLLQLYDLGDKLESYDMELKVQALDCAMIHLDKQRKDYEKELGQKKKVSTTFCLFTGMLVLILFF